MGVYIRSDSPWYWLLLERPGQKPIKEGTKIQHDAPDAMSRKLQRQLADEAYRARMNELAKARYELPQDTPTTIGFAAYADWFDTHHIAKRKGRDREREILKHLRAFFGNDDLLTITRDRAQEYATHRLAQTVPRTTRTVDPNTVNREVALLKGMLREAVPKYLKVNPLHGMKQLRVVKSRKRVLTPAEESRLLAELSPADRALYVVAIDTLIRLSNALNLRWADVHGKTLVLRDSKTGPYTVPLSARAVKALKGLKRTSVYVFPHRRTAENPRDWRGAIRLALTRACKRAKVPYGRVSLGVTWHTATRATAATRMLRKGHDLRTVQEAGNWTDMRSVQRYLESDARLVRRAVNDIGKGVTGA